MSGKEIISVMLHGEFCHRFGGVYYIVCKGDTLVVLSDSRLDCRVIDKILQDHCFRYYVWVSFSDEEESFNEVNRIKGKTFKITEYVYHPSTVDEDNIKDIKNDIWDITNGTLNNKIGVALENKPIVRLKTTYRLMVSNENGKELRVRDSKGNYDWESVEDAKQVAYRLYTNHPNSNYVVFMIEVMKFPMAYDKVNEMEFPYMIERINESKNYKNMKQNKRTITESQLRQIIAEAIKNSLGYPLNVHPYEVEDANEILEKINYLLHHSGRNRKRPVLTGILERFRDEIRREVLKMPTFYDNTSSNDDEVQPWEQDELDYIHGEGAYRSDY